VLTLLILTGGMGLVTATAALWVQARQRVDRRFFAGLVSITVTLILFSVIAWAAIAVVRIAPIFLTWIFVGTLALLFALRLYRELQVPPPGEPR
jgi:hypothetical protein